MEASRKVKVATVVLLSLCIIASWGLLFAVLHVDKSVGGLHSEVLALRGSIVDRTREAEDLHNATLDQMHNEYTNHISAIRDDVETRMKVVENRNSQMLTRLDEQLVSFDSALREFQRQTQPDKAPPRPTGKQPGPP